MKGKKGTLDLFAQLVEQYARGELDGEVWQKRPYTAVKVSYGGRVEFGFSKVCYPDKWSATQGELWAVKQALRTLVPRLMKESQEDE